MLPLSAFAPASYCFCFVLDSTNKIKLCRYSMWDN
ncbi:hypothetical protein NC652_012091 [Populus alba x Populus x berolinensis]|uniref:Uncharacterized protein n=1 Tax=Populus alba x Populus x berolinensis TaxID=444605 RepID=A0AAD6R439_9ROSI|nr:hypothetical protein NC652_012091 [Populus alba x Populus x berolinensis]KAJ7002029.1 hypothetical protein NC653_012181 [Populus alba x Populus x berolinensis]